MKALSRRAFGAGVVFGALTVMVCGPCRAQEPGGTSSRRPRYAGVLKLEDDKPGARVHVEGDNTLVFRPLRPFKLPEGLIFEFWLTPTRGPDFILLGRSATLQPMRFTPAEVAELGNGDRVLVVAEKPGGAASGKMEGPFVMVGELASRR
jgi:anti-sigma-K factor RskA